MILITGGAGFIGSFLVDQLLKKGESVTIFDNFSNSSQEGISNLLDRGACLVEGDIRNYEVLEKSLVSCNSEFKSSF